MKKILITFLLLILISAAPVSAANEIPGRLGESVYPLEDNDIELVSEEITLTYLELNEVHVQIISVFHNTGESDTVLMGFPSMLKYDADDNSIDPENLKLKHFTAFKNGEALMTETVSENTLATGKSEYSSWNIFNVWFDKDETITITNTYHIRVPVDSSGQILLGLILETGHSWEGNIQQATVTFDISKFNAYGVMGIYGDYPYQPAFTLSDLRYKDGKVIFYKENFDPDFNISLRLTESGLKDWWGIDKYRTGYEWESVEFFEAADDYNREQLIDEYNNLNYDKKPMETIYLNTRLTLPVVNSATELLSFQPWQAGSHLITVRDPDFDILGNARLTFRRKDGTIISQTPLQGWYSYDDYGVIHYLTGQLQDADIYELRFENTSGHVTVAVLDTDFNILKQTVSQPSVSEVENPKTNTHSYNLGLAVLLTFMSLALLIFKEKLLSSKNLR